jgi:hypothetical protein
LEEKDKCVKNVGQKQMSRIYNNLKRIFEKSQIERSQDVYRELLEKFVVLLTYEDTYLMRKMFKPFVLRQNGEDMFIDCGGFGVIIDNQDKISIHT